MQQIVAVHHYNTMNECNKLYLSQLAIEGHSQAAIADKMGISSATVSRTLSDDNIKAKIAYCRNEIVEKAYDKSVDNVVQVIQDYNNKATDKDGLMRKEHGFRASMRMLESMGLIESRTSPSFIQNILIQNNQTVVSPLVDQVISSTIGNQLKTIEVLPVVDDEDE
jgi:predicted transcriptional regulator